MEVRCCCKPQKLLGWLDVPDNCERVVRLSLIGGAVLELPIAPVTFYERDGHSTYAAIKSEETPLEMLRQVVGFRENCQADLQLNGHDRL